MFVPVELKGWHGRDAAVLCDLLVLIYVDFGEFDKGEGVRVCHLLENGPDLLAGPAPSCGEVYGEQ